MTEQLSQNRRSNGSVYPAQVLELTLTECKTAIPVRIYQPRGEQGRKMASEALVSTMVDRIVGRFRPLRVVLFGSQARGTATEWSDVDLLVVLPDVSDKRRTAIEIRRSLGDLPASKDIVVSTPEEIERRGHLVGSVLHAALREGRVVYELA